MQKTFSLLVATLLLVAALAPGSQAQTALGQPNAADAQLRVNNSRDAANVSTISPATQAVINSLSTLPEADLLIYVNPQRILNEAVPKFLPEKDLEGMRKGFEDMKKMAGVDPTKLDYLIIAVRFRKPTADLNFQAPEFMVVSSGDFGAEALMIFGFSTSFGSRERFSFGGSGAGASSFLAFGAFLAGFAGASGVIGIVTVAVFVTSFGFICCLIKSKIICCGKSARTKTSSPSAVIAKPFKTDCTDASGIDLVAYCRSPAYRFARIFAVSGLSALETPR